MSKGLTLSAGGVLKDWPEIRDKDGLVARTYGPKAREYAALFAASEKLLAALKVITEQYVDLMNSGDCGTGMDAEKDGIVIEARAIMAEAEGKAP